MTNVKLRLQVLVRSAVCALLVSLIVFVYFKYIHVNPTTVALTFLLAVLVVAASWGLSYAVATSILAAGRDIYHRRYSKLGGPGRVLVHLYYRQPALRACPSRNPGSKRASPGDRKALYLQPAVADHGQRCRTAEVDPCIHCGDVWCRARRDSC